MSKLKRIINYDFKHTVWTKANICIFVLVLMIELMDSFPTTYNLNRLEYLTDQSYIVMRVMTQSYMILLLGVSLVVTGRFAKDINRIKDLLMTSSISEKQIIFGKIIGIDLGIIVLSAVYYCIIALVQAIFNPGEFKGLLYIISFILFILPAIGFFISSSCFLVLKLGNIATYLIMVAYVYLNISSVFDIKNTYSMYLFGGNLYSKLYQGNLAFTSEIFWEYLMNISWYIMVVMVSIILYITKKQRWRECK